MSGPLELVPPPETCAQEIGRSWFSGRTCSRPWVVEVEVRRGTMRMCRYHANRYRPPDPPCIRCGSRGPFWGRARLENVWDWRCESCGYEWRLMNLSPNPDKEEG